MFNLSLDTVHFCNDKSSTLFALVPKRKRLVTTKASNLLVPTALY